MLLKEKYSIYYWLVLIGVVLSLTAYIYTQYRMISFTFAMMDATLIYESHISNTRRHDMPPLLYATLYLIR